MLFGSLRKYLELFVNLQKNIGVIGTSSDIFKKFSKSANSCSEDFWRISKIFGQSSEIFGKSIANLEIVELFLVAVVLITNENITSI